MKGRVLIGSYATNTLPNIKEQACNQSFFWQKITKRSHAFLKRDILSQIPYLKRKICQIAAGNWFFGGECSHIDDFQLHIKEFIGKDSPVKLRDARHSGSIRDLKKKTLHVMFLLFSKEDACKVLAKYINWTLI